MTSGTQEMFFRGKTEVADFNIKIQNNLFFVILLVIHFLNLTTIRAEIWSKRVENVFLTSARL